MIISDQEVSWAYLLGPCFQLQNTKGVPLTGGYIEVYIHGTRDKYYCASDFAGTLHPFQIPLDSLGSNIVLASTEQAYDVYVYNRFGSLIMSRYNVIPVNGTSEGGGGTSNISITSSDGTITVTDTLDPETGIKTYDLSVPWASGDASYWHSRGASNQGQLISDTDTHVLAISEHAIDHEGEDITVGSDGKFHLKEGVYFWTVNVDLYSDSLSNNTQQIYINSNINRASYKMDMTRDNQHSVSFSGITVATQDDFQEGFTIKTEGQTIRAAIYEVAIHKLNPKVLGTKYDAGYGIVIEDDTISVDPEVIPSVSTVSAMIQEAVTSIEPGEIYTAGEYIKIEDNEISVTGLQPAGDYLTSEDLEGYATESFVTGYVEQAISEIPEQVQSNWDQTDDTKVDYIKNKPDLDIYATHDEVNNVSSTIIETVNNVSGEIVETVNNVSSVLHEEMIEIGQAATGAIPDVSDFTTHEDVFESAVTSIQLVTGMIPDVSDYATNSDVFESAVTSIQLVTGLIPTDYATDEELQDAIELVTGKIPELPDEEEVEFEEINLSDYALASAIPDVSNLATKAELQDGLELVTGLIPELPDEEEVEFEEINLSDYALASAIPDVSDFATHEDVFESAVTSIQLVTGIIPEAQVQSDWTETDNTDPSYIQNKPNTINLVAGDNINIIESSNDLVISCTAIPVVTGFATKEELQDGLELVTGLIPTNYATDEELQDAIELVTGMIPEAQVQSDWAQNDDTQVDYIKNKPAEYTVVAGQNIGITVNNNDLIISASGTDLTGYVTDEELQDAIELVTGMIPDTSSFATHAEVNNVSGAIVNEIPDVSDFVTEDQVTALLPDEEEVEFEEIDLSDYALASAVPTVQLNSNDQVTAINNHPIAGGGGGGGSYTPGNGIDITNDVISVDNTIATKVELQDGIELVTGMIPEEEEVEFEELDLSDYALASAIPAVQLNSNDQVTGINNYPLAESGTSYTAGDGIDITNDVISVDDTVVTTAVTSLDFQNMGFRIDNNGQAYKADEHIAQSITATPQYMSDAWLANSEYNFQRVPYNSNLAQGTYYTFQDANYNEIGSDHTVGSDGIVDLSVMSDSEWSSFAQIYIRKSDGLSSYINLTYTPSDIAYALITEAGYKAGNYVTINNAHEISVTGLLQENPYNIFMPNCNFAVDHEGQASKLAHEANYLVNETVEFDNSHSLTLNKPALQLLNYKSNLNWITVLHLGTVNYQAYDSSNNPVGSSYTMTNYGDFLFANNYVSIVWDSISYIIITTTYDGSWGSQEVNIYSENFVWHEYALRSEIPDVTGFATKAELQDAVEVVTGMIPEAQVQSDWTQNDDTQVDYIKNKPNEYTVVAGDNIGIMIDNNDLVISASGVDLSDYTTFEDVVAMVSGVTGLTEYGQFYSTNITSAATMNKIKGTIEVTNDGKIKLKKGSSYHVTVRGRYNQTTAANTYGDISYIEYITNQSIHVNVDNTIAEAQYFELSYDLYKLNNDSNYYVYFSMNGGTVNDLFIEIHSLDGIEVTSIPSSYATDTEVYEATVTAVQMATGAIPAQVQSDWAVTAIDSPAYIQNKPTEKNLIAGANVTITESNDEVTIETTEIASGLQLIAGDNIVMSVTGNNLVISAAKGLDETVLYTASSAADSITTTEEVTNFERLRIELQSAQSTYVKNCLECKPDANNLVYTGTALIPAATYPLQMAGVRYTSSNAKNFTFSSATRMCYKVNGTYGDSSTTTLANSDIKDVGFITKIVGINRIS